MKTRIWIASATCAFASLFTSVASAQDKYPDRQISIIVAATPGNANDILARAIARRLSEKFGVPAIVDNKPGAGGTIGATLLARAKPDGYTLMVQSTSLTTAQVVYKKPGFDVEKDFTPIAMLALAPMGIFVNATLPVNTVAELIAYGKKNQGKLNFGSSGNGSIMHINSERLALETGFQMVHIPYTGGAPAVTALMANDIQVLTVDIASAIAAVRAGKVRMLAIGSTERLPAFPAVPTTGEAGLPFNPAVWYGLFAPAGVPANVQKALFDEISAMVNDPTYRTDMESKGSQVPVMSGAQFKNMLSIEVNKYREVITKAKIQQE
jgi:tripartite-type tricarboxylate transporter receptor subunit TctC